uniref:DUF262 domain-containing protein n=1 Tax=candidate division WOR-3 bacterium TaxID=2052148 RepID=A0A7C4GHX4_UNCW3
MLADGAEVEVEGLGEDDESVLPERYSITSYGADFLVDGLVRRIQKGDIYVPPWQRGFVWTLPQASRFIESLLWGLPVPGIFLAKEADSQKLVVVDGQQRLRTLEFFIVSGIFGPSNRAFSLEGVQSRYQGKTYATLTEVDRRVLNDAVIHATVFKEDSQDAAESCIYEVFRRLNTGGMLLSNQEVRVVQFHGELIDLLEELNGLTAWRELFGTEDKRKRDQELILRFLALYFLADNYSKPMKVFLNFYANSNRHLQRHSADECRTVFTSAMQNIRDHIGKDAFKPERGKLNAAVFDAFSVGVACRMAAKSLPPLKPESLRQIHRTLMENLDFRRYTSQSTSDEQAVKERIRLSKEAFLTAR